MTSAEDIKVVALEQGPPLQIVDGNGHAHAVIWPGMGAQLRSIHRIELLAGAHTIAMRHPSEAVYYVIDGSGEVVDVGDGQTQSLRPGSMAHIDVDTSYRFGAGDGGLSLVGGPSPPDLALYEGLT
jgi:mannose-6-phosphate isomerase-like protein (cupin superfamily)